MSEVDLCLVTPPTRELVYQGLSNEYAAIEPPVWAGLIATFIRNKGYSVSLVDAEAKGLSYAETARRIVAHNPAVTVFIIYGQQPSASTQCMPGGRAVAKELAKLQPDYHTVVMGTHASALPDRTLREEPYKYVCQGEGPYTVLGLLKYVLGEHSDLSSVPGLWYMDNGKIKNTIAAPKIKDLDAELPGQAWDLLDMSLYRAHNWHCFDHIDQRQPYASVQTSLGCPYKCSFCCINAPFGGSGIRYWSPENFISQVDILVERYGIKNIKIPDEMFVLNERHVLGICDLIIQRGYDLNIWAYARVDTVKEKFLERLRNAGFRWLALGIESGSKHVRDGIEKGRFGEDDIVRIVKKIQEAGIYVVGNYIFGLPDDTWDTMQQTLDLALDLNTEWANFYSAMAYPGSPLYRMALEKGWKLPEDWIGYSQHAPETLPLPSETLSGLEVLKFRDEAFLKYYTSDSYLSMIRAKFGEPVVTHIRDMTKLKLRRRYDTVAEGAPASL